MPPHNQILLFISAFAPGEEGAIHACYLDLVTGKLQLVNRTTNVENPFFLALSPARKHLYSIHSPGEFGGAKPEQVAAYEIVGQSGELTLLNRQSTHGTASCYLDIDSTGHNLILANYSSGSVVSCPIQEDGSLGKAASVIHHAGSSINPARQKGPHAHSIVVSPDNRSAYAADLGLDQILSYRLDIATAELVPNQQDFVRTPPGAGPRHLTFHPNARHLYVINEIGNSITQYDFNANTQMLIERKTISTLPDDFDEVTHCADLKITPDGRYLYGTNRGHDSIAAYRIGDDGQLALVAIHPSLGKEPQNLAITPDGKVLLCANMPGNNVVVFKINPETGELSPVGDPLPMPSPSCIMIL